MDERSLFYSGDARTVPRLADAEATRQFFKQVLHGLVHFADNLDGVSIDPNGRHQLSRVATVGVDQAEGDVIFDVSLPTATSLLDFIV